MTRKHRHPTQDFLPLHPVAFHILLALGDGDRHGYALKREIAAETSGRINPGPGVLYGTIRKLLDEGLIEESESRPAAHLDDERRRYYRLTGLGRDVARAEAARLRELLDMAERRVGLPDLA
jgi:DNA-binding PadR family transcriptional regulator